MIALPAPLKLIFLRLLNIFFTLFTIPLMLEATPEMALLIPFQAPDTPDFIAFPALLIPLKKERILLTTLPMTFPTAEITAFIPFHAALSILFKTFPEAPALVKKDLI